MPAVLRSKSTQPRSLPHRPVSTLSYFGNMPAVDFQSIRENMTVRKYQKHQTIFREEDDAAFIWFVQEGYVKEVHHLSSGRDKTLSLAGPQSLFGVSAFMGGRYGCDGVALTNAVLLSCPVAHFRVLMTRFPVLASAVLGRFSHLVARYKDKTRFAQESARCRLLSTLAEVSLEFGTTITLTRREIGEMAGLRVETTIRILGRIEKEGWMALSRGRITILDLRSLKKALSQSGGERLSEASE